MNWPAYDADSGTDHHTDPPRTPMKRIGVVLAGVVIVVSFFPWIWRWSPWADRTADGLLDDPTYALIADPICEAANAELEALPNALDAETTAERGDQVRSANAILHEMVDDLEAEITGSDRDVRNLNEWIGNWRTYLENRDDYAERIAVDENAVFYVAAEGIERLDRRIPRFANANEMWACITPDDIA